MKPWWNKYVGIPYSDRGRGESLDCFGLLIKVYKEEHGVQIFDPVYDSRYQTMGTPQNLSTMAEWVRVPHGQEHDVALYSIFGSGFHVGILLPKNLMLHCMCGVGVVTERVSTSWNNRCLGVFRHAELWSGKS